MSESPDLVIRWEIDEISKFDVGMEKSSSVHYVAGLPWRIVGKRPDSPENRLEMFFECLWESESQWSCEAAIEYIAYKKEGPPHFRGEYVWRCDAKSNSINPFHFEPTHLDPNEEYVRDDKITVEFRITVNNVTGVPDAPMLDFSTPDGVSNVALIVEDKKLHLSKEFLAVHSPVFAAMFFGDFAEKGKEEVEIKDVAYEEFLNLLHVIYPRKKEITASSVSHILPLADRFQMESALDQSESYLLASKKFDTVAKLELADRFGLKLLRDITISSYAKSKELAELKTKPEFKNFSLETKSSILHRLMDLALKE